MLKKILHLSLSVVVVVPTMLNLSIGGAISEESRSSISEDQLETVNGLAWGAPGWPYSKSVEIKDSLVGKVLGRVVLDRHGEDKGSSITGGDNTTNNLFGSIFKVKSPFSEPRPQKKVFVSLWGSKIDGCFTELIVQYATNGNNVDPQTISKALVPKVLELGVNGQIIELTPQPSSKEKVFSQNYTYTETGTNNTKIQHSGTWYMARNLFRIDSKIADVLSNASGQEVKARITFGADKSVVFPIGAKTVKRWKDAYSFNPRCTNLNKAQGKTNTNFL